MAAKCRLKSKQRGQAWQTYAIDAEGKLVHAGVHNAPRMTVKILRRMQRKWLAWRARYLLDNPGDYPLRDPHPRVVTMCVHPCGEREKWKEFSL